MLVRTLLFPTLILLALYSNVSSADQLTNEAQRLLLEGKAQAAYDLLMPQMEQRSGSIDYDLLLGIAAVDSGHPTQAVFALERVLAFDQNNQRARLELARAYFEAGENEASREEFNYVLSSESSAAVSKTIGTYLTEINRRVNGKTSSINFNIETKSGYDTNINNATNNTTLAIPAFGNLVFNLDKMARELSSGFYQLGGQTNYTSALSSHENVGIFASLHGDYRQTWHHNEFDTASVDGNFGLVKYVGENSYIASVMAQSYAIDFDISRKQAGVTLQWLRNQSKSTLLSISGQALTQLFPGQKTRDVDQFMLAAGFVHTIESQGAPIVSGGLSAGVDNEHDKLYTEVGRIFSGVNLGAQYTLRNGLNLVSHVSYQNSRFGYEPLFLKKRIDHFFLINVGAEYMILNNWLIKPEVQQILNKSNLSLHDFNSLQISISAQHLF